MHAEAGRRRLPQLVLRSRWLWALALFACAYAIELATGYALGLPSYLLLIVAGALMGSAILAWIARIPTRRAELVTLAGVAVGILVSGMILVPRYSEIMDAIGAALPEPVVAALGLAAIAAPPMAAWIWFRLLAEITAAIPRSAERAAAARTRATWEAVPGESGSLVRFTAVRMRMRTLVLVIIGTVIVGGAAGAGFAIWLSERFGLVFGPRLLVLFLGLLVGLPCFVLISLWLRRATSVCSMRFDERSLRLTVDGVETRIGYSELDTLRWREGSDYARVVLLPLRGDEISLLVGIARALPGQTSELPPLSERIRRLLAASGLVAVERKQLTVFERERGGGAGADVGAGRACREAG